MSSTPVKINHKTMAANGHRTDFIYLVRSLSLLAFLGSREEDVPKNIIKF